MTGSNPPHRNTKWSKHPTPRRIRPRKTLPKKPATPSRCCVGSPRIGNLGIHRKQMGHKDFTMLVRVYGKWMDEASEGELLRIGKQWKNANKIAPITAP